MIRTPHEPDDRMLRLPLGAPTNRQQKAAVETKPYTNWQPVKDKPGFEHDGCGHQRYDGLPEAVRHEREVDKGLQKTVVEAFAAAAQVPVALLEGTHVNCKCAPIIGIDMAEGRVDTTVYGITRRRPPLYEQAAHVSPSMWNDLQRKVADGIKFRSYDGGRPTDYLLQPVPDDIVNRAAKPVSYVFVSESTNDRAPERSQRARDQQKDMQAIVDAFNKNVGTYAPPVSRLNYLCPPPAGCSLRGHPKHVPGVLQAVISTAALETQEQRREVNEWRCRLELERSVGVYIESVYENDSPVYMMGHRHDDPGDGLKTVTFIMSRGVPVHTRPIDGVEVSPWNGKDGLGPLVQWDEQAFISNRGALASYINELRRVLPQSVPLYAQRMSQGVPTQSPQLRH